MSKSYPPNYIDPKDENFLTAPMPESITVYRDTDGWLKVGRKYHRYGIEDPKYFEYRLINDQPETQKD